ncbi:MAG: response regulator [Desulfarculus sp.]|nr:response regulator [Desulfarculus sp.]
MAEIKVLLVDDEPDFMEPLTNRLTLRKLKVHNATNGADALKLLDQEPMDVVVLDVKMPGMSGLDVIRHIKKAHPLVEVIMLTGHANLEVSIEGMELGAFDYLLKPAVIDELVYKIQDAFQKKTLQEKKISALKETASK